MKLETIEKLIDNALEISKADSVEKRLNVYKAASNALAKSDKLSTDENKKMLYEAIANIEKRFQEETSADIAQDENTSEDQTENDLNEQVEPISLDSGKKPYSEELPPVEKVHAAEPEITKRKFRLVGLGVLSIIVLSFGYHYWMKEPTSASSNNNSTTSETQNSATAQNSTGEIKIILPADVDKISKRLKRANMTEKEQLQHLKNGQFVISEKASLFAGPQFEVDIEKSYFTNVEFKIIGTSEKQPILNIGFVTFDKEGNVETSKPGPHRYFVHRGRLKAEAENDNIYKISNLITGSGNSKYDEFRPGTKFARPILLIVPEEGTEIILSKFEISVH